MDGLTKKLLSYIYKSSHKRVRDVAKPSDGKNEKMVTEFDNIYI
jgi:hypothetical protein